MEEKYVREEKIIDKTESEKRQELVMSILQVKKELDKANKNYEYAEEDLIDYYSYQIKANCSKMDYLLKLAKEKGIVMNMVEQIKIKYNEAM